MSDDTEQLCRRAKTGDVAAASELITRFYQRMFAFFRRLCGNDADAEDLTQKTFARVWSALPTFQGRSSFSTWIHGIGHHVYLDWRRKGDRLDFPTADWWDNCEMAGPGPFENAAERDLAQRLFALVEQLEDGERAVVHLHYYQGLSLKETAEALDIAASTVKYRLRGALDFLRSQPVETGTRRAANLN